MVQSINTKRLTVDHRSQSAAESGGVIRFNLMEENKIRILARREYDLLKELTTLKYPVKKITSIKNNIAAQRQFKVGAASNHIIIDIRLGNDELKNFDILNELRDHLQIHDNFTLCQDMVMTAAGSNDKFQRFLLQPKEVTNDDVLKTSLKSERNNLKDIADVSPMVKVRKEENKQTEKETVQ